MIVVYIALALMPVALMVFLNIRKKKKSVIGTQTSRTCNLNNYERDRNVALNVNEAMLNIAAAGNGTQVYGVVTDIDMGEKFMTLACFLTGATSLLFSSGGGLKGGGKNPAVGEATADFVAEAQEYLMTAQPIKIPGKPQAGKVQFILLTNKGKYLIADNLDNLQDNSSVWQSLFRKSSLVIAELYKADKFTS